MQFYTSYIVFLLLISNILANVITPDTETTTEENAEQVDVTENIAQLIDENDQVLQPTDLPPEESIKPNNDEKEEFVDFDSLDSEDEEINSLTEENNKTEEITGSDVVPLEGNIEPNDDTTTEDSIDSQAAEENIPLNEENNEIYDAELHYCPKVNFDMLTKECCSSPYIFTSFRDLNGICKYPHNFNINEVETYRLHQMINENGHINYTRIHELGPYICHIQCLLRSTGLLFTHNNELNYAAAKVYADLVQKPWPHIIKRAIDYCVRPAKHIPTEFAIHYHGQRCQIRPYLFTQCMVKYSIKHCPHGRWSENDKCNAKRELLNSCNPFMM